jgi:hypothetical protein
MVFRFRKLEWTKVNQDIQTNNRFGHTSIIYQNKIYLYGGRTKYGGSFVSPGLEIFSLNDKCFINHDLREEKYYDARGNEILYEYMQHELRDAGIWLAHVYRETTTPDTVVEIQKVIIEVPREKEYTDEIKKLIK